MPNLFKKINKINFFKIGISILVILLIFLGFILFEILTANAEITSETESAKIEKAYSWLESKTVGKWNFLTTDQHVFSFLTLQNKLSETVKQSSLNSLLSKSNQKQCWPRQSCSIKETALAKLALDTNPYYTNNASAWLLSNSQSPSGIEFYLQITPKLGYYNLYDSTGDIQCNLSYNLSSDVEEYSLTLDDKSKIYGNPNLGGCFTIEDNSLLKLNKNCYSTEFNISCNNYGIINFVFKKENSNKWYVTKSTYEINPENYQLIRLESYCLKNQLTNLCDYEGTLWAAYAFYKQGDSSYTKFIPYLVGNYEENLKYLPESFLYTLTKNEIYGDLVLDKKVSLITLSGTAYNEYYDSALAYLFTEGYSKRSSLLGMKTILLNKQNSLGYWGSADNIRETAMTLYSFWQDSDLIYSSECESFGYSCVSNCSNVGGENKDYTCSNSNECCYVPLNCDEVYGTCLSSCGFNQKASIGICSDNKLCCQDYSRLTCVGQLNGEICSITDKCVNNFGTEMNFITSSDSQYCCLGNCDSGITESCSSLGGVICSPYDNKSCSYGGEIDSSEEYCCYPESCSDSSTSCNSLGGRICQSNEVCSGADLIYSSDSNNLANCCPTGECIPQFCSDENGEICDYGQECSGETIQSGDANVCCINGKCLSSCSSLDGEACPSDKSCDGDLKRASDTSRCCVGKCKSKSNILPMILIFLILIILGLGVFLFIKNKEVILNKINDLKNKKNKTKSNLNYQNNLNNQYNYPGRLNQLIKPNYNLKNPNIYPYQHTPQNVNQPPKKIQQSQPTNFSQSKPSQFQGKSLNQSNIINQNKNNKNLKN